MGACSEESHVETQFQLVPLWALFELVLQLEPQESQAQWASGPLWWGIESPEAACESEAAKVTCMSVFLVSVFILLAVAGTFWG